MNLDFDSLNDNQRTAVEWDQGPLLVLAGPGSGKTRVLTLRVARLILESPDKRFRVLGLTFTNKAAAEMRQRVEEMVSECRDRVLLTTFHSFCADILRQHGSHVGIRPDFAILNQEADRESVLYDAIDCINQEGISVDKRDMRLLPLIDRLLANVVPETEVMRRVQDKNLARRLSVLYSEYRRQLVSNNRLDFSSLLVMAYEVLTSRPAIAKQIRTIYPYVCVDEFQDTNLAQYMVLKAIVGEQPRDLFVVADDDQIIYQWNGASPQRLQSLRDDFGMKVVQLPANYRCPPEVIALANKLISHNLERSVDKEPLYPAKAHGGPNVVRVRSFATMDEELRWVAKDIAHQHSTATAGCVILARTRRVLEAALSKLEEEGVAASLAVRKSEFTSTPFRWLHAMLRLANARGDREQLRRVCKAFYELEGINLDVQEITANAAGVGGDLLRAWFDATEARAGVRETTLALLAKGRQQIVDRLDPIAFASAALRWFDELNKELSSDVEEGFADFQDERAVWDELQRRLLGKHGREELTLNTFLQEFDLSEKTPPIPDGAVRCLTIHSAKGMEFRHVYLVGLVEDQLPSYQSMKKGDHSLEIQEERRNCFVAITRTQETLTMTYATECFGWPKKTSRFLHEMELI